MEEDGVASPGWPASADSRLQSMIGEAYRTVTGEEMLAEPVHAGLECGWFAEKNPALDMVAIGPTLHDVHSPEETLELDSIPNLYAAARLALERIAAE